MTEPQELPAEEPRSIRDRWDDVEVEVTSAPEPVPDGPPIEDPN